MRKLAFGYALAGALVLSASLAAEHPMPQTPQTPTAQDPARPQDEAKTVTVEGCLVREADVPGRQPNVAERAGIGDDYILTSTKIIKGSAPASARARSGEQPTGTAGANLDMYEVEGIDDEQLKSHVGRRVRIDGKFENVDRAGAETERGTSTKDLVEIRASAIRPVAGECPPASK